VAADGAFLWVLANTDVELRADDLPNDDTN
jgi:hypothetical protein